MAGILSMTQSSGLTTVAIGCDVAQGYYFSKPLPADGIFQLLKETHDIVSAYL